MERIVLGISAINFNNSNDILTEKSIVASESFSFQMATTPSTISDSGTGDESIESPAYAAESDQTDSESTPPQRRRSLPPRLAKSKENSLLRIKRRSIMKPRRNLNVEIKKIYLDNKVKGNFRPSNLETIFEEPTPDKNKQLCFIGAKKIRRSLSCSDGLNVTKTMVKSRRNKIKKTFGRRFALKKISLDDFIDRLNASFDERPTTSRSLPQTPTTEEKTDDIPILQPLASTTTVGDSNEADDMECGDETSL